MSLALEDIAAAAKEQLAASVTAAFAQEGYVDSDGDRASSVVVEAAYAAVSDSPVDSKGQREAKGLTRLVAVATVFPSLAKTPTEWNAEPDPGLAEKTHGEVAKLVWEFLKPDRSGKVQQLVGLRMPGFVLCRTKVGVNNLDAVYVTDDVGCITEDFTTPLNASILRANRTMGRNMAMVVDRLPETATKWERLYKNANKKGLEAGLVPLDMALEAARNNGNPGGDDNPGE